MEDKQYLEKLKVLTETIENLQELIINLQDAEFKHKLETTEEISIRVSPNMGVSFYFPELPDSETQEDIRKVFNEFIDKLQDICLKRYNSICDSIIFNKVR